MDDLLDYGRLIDEAMHDIVKKALSLVAMHGFPQDHHFYITFLTQHPGVMLPDDLLDKYPEEMTIVLQHQFWDLEVELDRFNVVLSFDSIRYGLTVPFAAIASFADPSVKFGLQFRLQDPKPSTTLPKEGKALPADDNKPASKKRKKDAPLAGNSNVVTLDSFRKKK